MSKNNIGGITGINTSSVNRNQASGGPVGGYGKPGTSVSQYAQGRTGTQGAAPAGPKHGSMPATKHNEAKGGGKSKSRM